MELTISDLKELMSASQGQQVVTGSRDGLCGMVGKKVIIRTYSAGVWFGRLTEKAGNEVIITQARRMWRWQAAKSISLSGVALHGIDASRSKIVDDIDSVWLEAIEIIPVSGLAAKSIEDAASVEAE